MSKKKAKKPPSQNVDPTTIENLTSPPAKIRPGDPIPDYIRELFEKRRKYLTAGKSNYGKADRILEELLERCEVGVTLTLDAATRKGKPESHTLSDRFADTNQVWAGSSCRRFDVVVKTVKPQDVPQTETDEQDAPDRGKDAA
ncbi:MAG: hypothetical protein AAGJ83_10540 [Planctomycetota bacterium]